MQPLLTLFHSSAKKNLGFQSISKFETRVAQMQQFKCRIAAAKRAFLPLNFSFIADSPRVLGCQVKKQAVTTKGYRTTVHLMLVL